VAASGQVVPFADNFQGNLGWTVQSSPGLSTGAWERGIPAPSLAAPSQDADGSGMCYLTQIDEGQDIDGGETTLTSPLMSPQGAAPSGVYLSYWRWYSNNQGADPNNDAMPVEISDNGGASWVLLENVTENAGTWVQKSFRVEDYVAVTDQLRLRFRASDLGAGSYVEAGVDGVQLVAFECPARGGSPDVNGDGVVDVQDLVAVITAWGACPPDPAPCPSDVDGDGAVGVTDLVEVITNWG
jgi:hypothetical protein